MNEVDGRGIMERRIGKEEEDWKIGRVLEEENGRRGRIGKMGMMEGREEEGKEWKKKKRRV